MKASQTEKKKIIMESLLWNGQWQKFWGFKTILLVPNPQCLVLFSVHVDICKLLQTANKVL